MPRFSTTKDTPIEINNMSLQPGTRYRESGLVVRPRRRLISTVQVRVGENHSSVVKSNCVVARRGGEQLEKKDWSAG